MMNQDRTVVINVDLTWRIAVVLGVFLLGLLCAGELGHQAWGARRAAASEEVVPLSAAVVGRQYYLAGAVPDGTEAMFACAAGYHMASLWEILDTSSLRYNSTLGLYGGDSDPGPPTVWSGWVRTGFGSNNSATPGKANCLAWSSKSGQGTTAALPGDWTVGQDLHVWNVSTSSCEQVAKVWCVED